VNDFVAGLRLLLKPRGTITIEFPHLMRLVEENQFDTIYHEHFSYFSFLTADALFARHGLRVFDVEVEVTGGQRILRPGMTANVRISGPVRRDVVRVPVEAVLLQEGKPIVYKIGGSGPQPVAVTLGLSDLFYVELAGGLAPGDSIALEDPVAAAERARNPARRR